MKSRFSHRQIFLFSGESSGPDQPTSGFDDRLKLFQHLLSLPDDENVNEIDQQYEDCNINPQFGAQWNEYIQSLTENETMVNLLKRMYQMDVSEKNFRNFLAVVVSSLSEKHRKLEVNDFVEANKMFSQDDKVLMLQGLSALELCLVRNIYLQANFFPILYPRRFR